jgi:hypothetical protein
MTRSFVRSASAVLLGTFLFAACSDNEIGATRLKPVHAGMPKDSVMAIIGQGPLTAHYADTLRLEQGFRHSTFFIDGNRYEVLYYREATGDVTEPVEQEVETPVVLSNGKALGWGWRFYVEAMEKYKLPTPLKEKAAATP